MAVHKLTDAVFTINSVALSSYVKGIELPQGCESLDDTFMGDTTRSSLGGLLTWSVKVTLGQDYAASQVDATISPLVGTVTTFTTRATSAATSSTNPQWSGSCLVKGYKPVGGQVGELHLTELELESAGTLTRATA